ncbi:MAG TPA: CHAT domain-containing protein, partial [Chitinophagaceae bacterium]|nr:CHAT domain-containing protein [Chitinophagaceae bacterium]
YFQQGAKAMLNQPKQYYRQAYSIYDQLFGRHPLRADKAYIILPDGAASSLPVDALVTQPGYSPSVESWPFVIKQTQVSYAYSLQTLKEQLLSRSAGKGFTGFFIEQNTRQQPDLAAVVQEREGIAQTVQSGQWLINEQATANAFRDALDHAAVVHISTHAFAKKDSIDAPHIELYNEPFYLFELKSMQQHPAMVVLSACRTGDGRLVTGEGVQSLARAFIAGSTNAVVAGWWNVNDEAAAQLMQQFYASLSGSNHAAGALRQAKLGWLNNKDISYLHKLPYYWAALNYYGHPSPLPDNSWMKKSGPSVQWLLLLVLPVIVLLVFFRHRIIKYAAPQL